MVSGSMGNNHMEKEKIIQNLDTILRLAEECRRRLVKGSEPQKKLLPKEKKRQDESINIDLEMPMRPFIKKYGKDLSGSKKFTLLLAYLSKGKQEKEINLEEIEKYWNKMTAKNLLGMKFNRFYTGEAKDNDWVESKKKGIYSLRPSWRGIFS